MKDKLKFYEFLGKTALIFAVSFCFFLTIGIVNSKFVNSGDSFWHYSNEIHILRSIELGRGIFDCLHKGLWLPLANFYQPLFYLIVVILHMISLKTLSVYFFHNLLICLLFSIYPLSVYYLAKSFRFGTFRAGVISLFGVFPISGWGHTIDAYFSTGLHTQLIGAVLFPVVLGTVHRLSYCANSSARNKVFLLAFAIAGLVMGHAVFGILCVYSLMLYIVFYMVWRGLRSFLNLNIRFLSGVLLGVVIIAFWLVPFIKFNTQYKFIPESERSFSSLAVSVTPKIFFNSLFKGELLDNVIPGNPLFGGGEEGFRWSANFDYKRFGIFSLFSILGFGCFFLKGRRYRELFFVAFFLFSVILFMGKDDIALLRYLPYSRDFQPIRAVFLFELACAVMAGCFFCDIFILIDKFLNRRNRNYLACIFFILLLLPVIERYNISQILIISLTTDRYSELKHIYNTIKKDDPDGIHRTYYGRYSGVTNLALRSYADCNFINNAVGHDNEMAGSLSWLVNGFQKEITDSPELTDLYNIRFFISGAGWQKYSISEKKFPVDLMSLYCGSDFDLYRVNNKSGLFDIALPKTVLVWCTDKKWFQLNKLWISQYIKNKGNIAQMVKAPADFYHLIDTSYSDVIVLINIPPKYWKDKRYCEKLAEFRKNGGLLLTNSKHIPSIKLKSSSVDLFKNILAFSGKNNELFSKIEVNTLGLNRYKLNLTGNESRKKRLVVAKTAFYDCWKITSNGKQIDPLWVSPGFVGFFADPKMDTFDFEYIPSALHFQLLFGAIIVVSGFCWVTRKKNIFRSKSGKICFYHFYGLNIYVKVFRVFIILILGWLIYLYISQQVFCKTSLIYPYNGQEKINPLEIVFRWNKLSDGETYSFQMAESPLSFACPIFKLNNHKEDNVGYRGLKPGKWYFWRIRVDKGSKHGCWSKVYRFKTGSWSPVNL